MFFFCFYYVRLQFFPSLFFKYVVMFFCRVNTVEFRFRLLCCTFWFTLQAPTEPAILLASWKEVLTDTSDAVEGEGRARRWEGQVSPLPLHSRRQSIFLRMFWLVFSDSMVLG